LHHWCRDSSYAVKLHFTDVPLPLLLREAWDLLACGTYLWYRAKLAKFDLIIFDEMGMRKFTTTEAQDLSEIIEERSIDKSIAFTSQLPVDH
jgi:DNA replication protein DnaC